MNLLCVDTSQKQGSFALVNQRFIQTQNFLEFTGKNKPKVIQQITWNKKNSHSGNITLALQEILQKSSLNIKSIEGLCVSTGPGSFTGVRISIAFAKSLSHALNIPVFTSNSLKLLAIPYLDDGKVILSLINAYNNMAFVSAYQLQNNTITELLAPSLHSGEKVPQLYNKLKPYKTIGNGASLFLDQQTESEEFVLNAQPHALDLIKSCFFSNNPPSLFSWESLNPIYLKGSHAEEKLKQNLLKPLPQA